MTDPLGSTLGLANGSGTILTQYTYEPFGKSTSSGSTSTPFQFTGRENDGTGLSYYRARYYSPSLQRFISEDPIGFHAGPNFYSYVRNSPPNLTDALGLLDDASPWTVGWEWFTGNGPRQHNFKNGDPFTEMLKKHSHIQDLRDHVATQCGGAGSFGNDLSGLKGVPKYFRDYSTLLTFGQTGNLAATYLGSYNLQYSTVELSGRKSSSVLLEISVQNPSTAASALRPPWLGYTQWWQKNVAPHINNFFSSGPMSKTEQTFYWTEVVTCQAR